MLECWIEKKKKLGISKKLAKLAKFLRDDKFAQEFCFYTNAREMLV